MKNIILAPFIILFAFITSNTWALPDCPSNQNAYHHNCFGTYVWDDGDKYVGEFKDDKLNGKGTYYFLSNDEYKGDKYIGEFKDGNKHGEGIYYYLANNKNKGDKYEGEYKDNKLHGKGTYTWANGAKEVGEYKNGMLNGFAIRYDKNGNIIKEGIWKDDEFQYAQKKSSSSLNSKLNKYKEFCKEIGFTPGTEKFGDCVLKAMEVE